MNRRGRPPHPDILTPREWEVLAFLREGLSNEQIADRLGITLRTAKFHVSEILSKLAVESREQAAAWQPGEAPAPARRWLAWPLIARVAGALVMVAAVAGLGLLAWGVLRTGGGIEGEAGGEVSAENIIADAILAVEGADSYRVEQDFDDDEQVDSIVEVASPDSSHSWNKADPTRAEPGTVWYETIVAQQRLFSRRCTTFEDCEAWQEYPLPKPEGTPDSVVVAVESPLGAQAGLAETLRLTRELEYIGDPEARHVRGETNPIKAILKAFQRQLEGFDSAVLEMIAEDLDGDIRFYDANPAPIEIWASADGYPTRIVIDQNAEHSQGTGKVDAHFSRFNEETITPPTDFIPMTTPTPTP